MELQIQPWGNSAGIRLTRPLLRQLKAEVGDAVEAEMRNGALVIRVVKAEPTLDELLATCTPENTRLTDEDRQWLDEGPLGNEI